MYDDARRIAANIAQSARLDEETLLDNQPQICVVFQWFFDFGKQ
jgi:hypothetical protein